MDAPLQYRLVQRIQRGAHYARCRIGTADTRFQMERMLYRWRLRLMGDRDPVLIHTMGKVGSSTVARSLSGEMGERSVLQVHSLSAKALAQDEEHHRKLARSFARTEWERRFYPYYVWRGQHVRKLLARRIRQGRPPIRVITLTRDPMARNLSSLFQNMRLLFDYDIEAELGNRSIDQIKSDVIGLFMDNYVAGSERLANDCDPLTWFDAEMKDVLGVDVYRERFPKENGYSIYESPIARVLALRLEDFKRCGVPAIGKFLHLPNDFTIKSANVGSGKRYGDVYRRVVSELRPPGEYLDRIYNSRMMRHFYTRTERAAFRRRWGS